MKKVLIVDDEYLVRLGLRTTFHWTMHGFEIVGEAANGEEAIQLFEKTDPDILFTDIKMPVMDGIRLIELLKAKKPSLYVVILSNHGDFAYAQEAIRLGAAQYILKSELEEKTIFNALRLASSSMQSHPVARRENGRLEQALRKNLLQRGSAKPSFSDDMIRTMAQGRYLVAFCQCDTSQLKEETQEIFHRSCRTMLEKLHDLGLIVSTETDHMLRVLLMEQVSDDEHAKKLFEHMRLLISNLRQYYEVEFRAGFSQPQPREALAEAVSQASAALDLCFFSNENCCLWEPQMPQREPASMVQYRAIESLIEARRWSPLKEELVKLFTLLRSRRDMADAESCYIDLLSIVRQIASANMLLGVDFLQEKKIDYYSHQNFAHIDAMEVYILDLYRSMLNILVGNGKRYSSIVTKSISFIHQNYGRSISLTETADEVGVSKSYLSLLFKQETSINFSKYLMDYRIERAKQLLENSSLRIYEIAEQVGFPNPYYFSKVFKDYMGESCKEYRDHMVQ